MNKQYKPIYIMSKDEKQKQDRAEAIAMTVGLIFVTGIYFYFKHKFGF